MASPPGAFQRAVRLESRVSKPAGRAVAEPPPKRDPEIGVGWHAAWQSPLHREAVRRALAELGG
jgi:hypothetical protein